VTTLELEPDRPADSRCGTCTACVDACPTRALIAPYRMDASRCISYLTIEHRGDIDASLQPCMGNWVFGCDVCQEVCPHNRHARLTEELRFTVRPPAPEPLLGDLQRWTPEEHRRRWRGSAVKRATPAMLARNASIAQENEVRRTEGL
jgi:epoxyqueuosine reductase